MEKKNEDESENVYLERLTHTITNNVTRKFVQCHHLSLQVLLRILEKHHLAHGLDRA